MGISMDNLADKYHIAIEFAEPFHVFFTPSVVSHGKSNLTWGTYWPKHAQTCPNRRPASFSANSQVCRTSGRRYLGARGSSRFRCGAKKPWSERIGVDRTGVYFARSGTELWSPAAVLGTKPIQPGDANWREAWQPTDICFPSLGTWTGSGGAYQALEDFFMDLNPTCCSRPPKKGSENRGFHGLPQFQNDHH